MVTFRQVDPSSIDTHREGRRGRVSYPLLKSFLERNIKMAELELTGLNKNPAYLRSVLTTYIRSHKLPIKLFQAGGKMYLMRLDLDNEGNKLDWTPDAEEATEGAGGLMRGMEPKPIDDSEVDARFHEEKNRITK
jgi:hypothetical protein